LARPPSGCSIFPYTTLFRSNAGQLLAWSFPAWALWAVIRLYQEQRARHAILLALALTGAFLSHNVVALLLPVVVACAAVWLGGVDRKSTRLNSSHVKTPNAV